MKYINGHKTQIAAVATLVTGFLISKGYISSEDSNFALGLLGVLLGISITHAEVKKSKKN